MSLMTDVLERQVLEAVKQAGALIRDPDSLQGITAKSSRDFVTNVDLEVEKQLRQRLYELAPQVQFLGEESNLRVDPVRPFWILDPVDGTTNFIHGFGHSAISLALAEEEKVTFGVVFHPYTGECFTARRGQGAWCNGLPIRVSKAERLWDGLFSTGTVPGRRDLADKAFRQMRTIYDNCQDIRRAGCASLDLCWVACGRLDGYLELALQPWDYAAGMLLVEEAGGCVTSAGGEPLSLIRGGSVAATNGILHHQLIELLK